MSENSPKNNASDEIDLLVIFNQLGKSVNKVYKAFMSVLKSLFSMLIYALKPIVNNIIVIVILMVVAGGVGYAIDRTKEPVYMSQMIVRPYFESKYPLVNNIIMYNALLKDRDYEEIKEVFGLTTEEAESIISINIAQGPETDNYKLVKYTRFLKSLDSVNTIKLSYDDYIKNRSIYNGEIFEIEVFSTNKTIFRALEEGLKLSFQNSNSLKLKQKRDSLISIDKVRISNSIKEVDSLKKVYIDVIKEESSAENVSGRGVSTEGLSLIQERINTREYDLLEKQMKLRDEFSELESKEVQVDGMFDTVSGFQERGTKYVNIYRIYTIILPILTFLLLIFGYIFFKSFKFIKEYE
ncbi:MAG: hypothetical protein V7719_10810 [Psychroserpens sp.]|uniref:hypothetical protein n=1 Tax=Psychroserpens sp. TaxID=2020870 RepID=UPI003002D8C1